MVNGTAGRDPARPRAALVTGASYGVGAATALALAQAGMSVAVTATKAENLAATMQALEPTGVQSAALALDVTDQASVDAALEAATRRLGPIDVLVNNAGLNLRKPALQVSREEWDAVIGTNLSGTFFLTTAFARGLVAAGIPGCVVNIASVHGLIGVPERSVYGISKGGLIQMTRMLAIEWAEHAIRVNAVAPGRLITASPSRAATGTDPGYLAAMLQRIPLHRFATAEEVAATAAFLAGPHAAAITGQVVVLDGGLTAE